MGSNAPGMWRAGGRHIAICLAAVCGLLGGQERATATEHAVLSVAQVISATLPAAGALQDRSAYDELLRVIPDTPDTRRQVVINDYARVRMIRNVSPPTDLGDMAQKQTYIEALFGPGAGVRVVPAFVSGMDQQWARVHIEQYLGYRRVDQDIEAGAPPSLYSAARGEFDPAAADRAIDACDVCPAAERGEFDGVPYYSWGEDFALNRDRALAPPAFDQLGRGGRYAIRDQFVLRALWTDGIQAMIAASLGGPSLGAVEDFRMAAQGSDRLGAYHIVISNRTQGPAEADAIISDAPSESRTRLEAGWRPTPGAAVLEPYRVFAAGAGLDAAGEPYTSIVLVHADEQSAQQNAGLLPRRIHETSSVITGRPWTDYFTGVEVNVRGRVLEARLIGRAVAETFWFMEDPLLLHR